jgi:hypothetical protein
LAKLFKSESRSQSALDKILPLWVYEISII